MKVIITALLMCMLVGGLYASRGFFVQQSNAAVPGADAAKPAPQRVKMSPVPTIPAFQGGGQLRGVAAPIAPPPYAVRWQITAGTDDDRAAIENSPTIAGDTAYVADNKGVLHALDLATGKARWIYKSESGFETTPLVLNGRVYLGDSGGLLHCISADKGEKIWAFDSEGGIHSSPNITPDGKTILFGNDTAQVFAVDAQTGKKLWEGKSGDRVNACPAIGHGAAFFTGCDARLLALDLKDGSEKFAVDLGGLAPGSPTIFDNGIVAATGEGTVMAFSPDGKQQLWKYEQVDEQGAMFYSSPAAADGLIVLGCRDRQVHAIDALTGKRAWAFKTKGEVDATAVISDGRVYIPSADKMLYVLDLNTGAKLWQFKAGRGVTAGAAIGSGVIVFGDSAGNIYCLEPKK
jgi:outer membrane protein assembly factor BamB